jgi:hypothetical protein
MKYIFRKVIFFSLTGVVLLLSVFLRQDSYGQVSSEFNQQNTITTSDGSSLLMGWSVPEPVSNGFIKWDPSLIQDSNGSFRCAFDGQDTGDTRIFWSINNNNWSSPQAITGGRDSSPSLIQDSTGNYQLAYSHWNEDSMWDIYWTSNSGNDWSIPVRLTTYANDDTEPTLIEDSNGDLHIIFSRQFFYTDDHGADDLYWMKYHDGLWSTPVALTNTDTSEMYPSLIQDSSGDLVAAYEAVGSVDTSICLMRYTNGVWSSPSIIHSFSNDVRIEGLSLVKADEGSLWLSFGHFSPSVPEDIYTGIGIISNQGGTWSAPDWVVFPELNEFNMNPSMIQDSEGNLRVSFRHSLGGIYWTKSVLFACGDVNNDGHVNMADVMILWYDIADYPAAGAWTIAKEWAADVNCDGQVNMADVMILWYDIADYPSAGAWDIICCE